MGLFQWLWRKLRGPRRLRTPREIMAFVLENFDQLEQGHFGEIETALMRCGAAEQHLVYALRIASVLPTVKTLKTLASRWNVAHYGPQNASGLMAARHSPEYPAVKAFLDKRFLAKTAEILAAPRKRKSDVPADIITLFVPPLPGLAELVHNNRATPPPIPKPQPPKNTPPADYDAKTDSWRLD
jgi:hypothetical protein